jgi:hypothetical protein
MRPREHAGDVALHRRRAEHEPAGDLGVREPLRDELEHLDLERAEDVEGGGS